MADLQFAGEFSLEKCELISSAGVSADISRIIVEINIFEDIFSTALTGSIIIADTNNLVDNMPIVGQEYVSFRITTPGLNETEIDYTENVFCVYELGGKIPGANSSEVIELKICSPELLRNHRTRVSKSFEETTDQIVKSVLENSKYINTKKDIFLEPTLGIRKILSPNYHPFDLIRNLTRESMSAKNNSPHYLFFENIHGYHFRSLQSLYEDGVQGEFHVGDKGFDEPYTYGSSDAGKIVQSYKRIINFSVPNKNNSLFDIRGGMLGSTLLMHDIFNKKYTKSTFGYFENFDEYPRVESAPKYNNVLIDDENTVGNFTDARIHLHPTSITVNDLDAQYIEYSTTHDPTTQFPTNTNPAEPVSPEVSGREQTVMQRLINVHGFSQAQAAGIVGNLTRESRVSTGARNRGDGTDGSDSIGIAQWNSKRAENLKAFAASKGQIFESLNLQVDFIVHELKGSGEYGAGSTTAIGTPSGAYGAGSESRANNALSRANDASSAAKAFTLYERFRNYDKPGNSEVRERQAEAVRIFNNYKPDKSLLVQGLGETGDLGTTQAEASLVQGLGETGDLGTTQADAMLVQGLGEGVGADPVPEETNKDYASNRADKWLLHRQQRLHELNNGMIINMSINGNTSVTVGQVIKITVPIYGTDHEDTGVSKHQSGLYLISKLRHTFSPPTRTHMISLQATKDSYPIELESKASGKEPKKGGLPTVYEL